ncbi:hypothetical protein TCAL_15591 [Tigriopus californicus]|uniref:Nucleotidyl transferase domain-containing protein n=1 Tax=Tigriopus californicus TaxID=6832 RepID=A0A553PBF8_TIGCA|nr:hypothetical protein TCAL_15591 [Tigriopus californicus]
MRVVLLCAGYGTRFIAEAEQSPNHRHLTRIPKPLLPIGGKPLIDHWLETLATVPLVTKIIIVANNVNFEAFRNNPGNVVCSKEVIVVNANNVNFEAFRDNPGNVVCSKEVIVVNDGSNSNEQRSGAITCMKLGLQEQLDEACLFIAGDTLFDGSFLLASFLKVFQEENGSDQDQPCSLIVDCPCPEERVHKHGIIETDATGRVVSFLEKPDPSTTASRKQSPCFYLIHQEHLHEIEEFLKETKNGPLKARDATGNFLKFLVERNLVKSLSVSKRFDVGGLDSYLECCEEFKKTA